MLNLSGNGQTQSEENSSINACPGVEDEAHQNYEEKHNGQEIGM